MKRDFLVLLWWISVAVGIFALCLALARCATTIVVIGPNKAAASSSSGGGGSCSTARDTQGSGSSVVDNVNYAWQSTKFTAGGSYTICQGVARMDKVGSPSGTVLMAIYTHSAGSDSPGAQVGTASGTINLSSLGTSEGDATFTGMSAALTSGTVYWVVLKFSTHGDASNHGEWRYGFTGVSTDKVKSSDDNGTTWDQADTSSKCKFTLYSN